MPPLEDFAPDEQSRQFIRDRLSGRVYTPTLEETADDLEDERQLLEGDYGDDAYESAIDVDAADEVADDSVIDDLFEDVSDGD